MSQLSPTTAFDALDICHQQVLAHLNELESLAQQMEHDELDDAGKRRAGSIEAFFSGTSRQHHADEEKTVFPLLLESKDERLVAAVLTLQQDHRWIETNWTELSPQLRAIASGNSWPDPTEFRNGVTVYVTLCRDHIALEETLIYPESKARWAAIVDNRIDRPAL